jgi:hypothetical protein
LGKQYSVELVNKSSGLDLDYAKWEAFKNEFLGTLKNEARLVHEIADKTKQNQFIKETLESLNKSIQDIQTEKYPDIADNPKTSATVKEKQINAEKGKKLKALFEEPKNKATLAFLKEVHLLSEAKQDILRTTDADLAIALIEDIHKAESYAKIGDFDIPPEVRGKIAGYNKFKIDTSITIDPQTKKPVDKGFFKVRLSAKGIPVGRGQPVTVVAEPIPRRFHGVWKDYMVKSCVRDQCNNYLTAALKDTEVHFIERVSDGGKSRSLNGFTQIMKFQDPTNPQVRPLSVIDIMSPEFNLEGQKVHPRTGKVEKLPILEWMVKEYSKDHRLYLSESLINSNGGNLELIEVSPGYKFSKPRFEASTLKLVDPNASEIFEKVKPHIPHGIKFLGWETNPYKDNWVSEATSEDSGHISRLSTLDSTRLNDPKVLENLFASIEKFKDPKLKIEVLNTVLEKTPWPESVWQKVPALLRDTDFSVTIAMEGALGKQPHWPEIVWQYMPALLIDTDPYKRRAMAHLREQPHWTQEVMDVLSKVGPDGKTLAEKLDLTQELEKRRARPPLRPLKSFSCPVLFQRIGAKGKAL